MRESVTSFPPDEAATDRDAAADVDEYGAFGAALYEAWQVRRLHHDWEVYSRILLPSYRRILDVGAGSGRLLGRLWQSGYAADGIDRSLAMAARFAMRREQPRGFYIVADFRELIPARAYDAALCSRNTLGYLATERELECTLKRLADALRPGGLAVVDLDRVMATEPFRETGDELIAIDGVEVRFSHETWYDPRAGRACFTADGEARSTSGSASFRLRSKTSLWETARFVAIAAASRFRLARIIDGYGAAVPPTANRHSRIYILVRS